MSEKKKNEKGQEKGKEKVVKYHIHPLWEMRASEQFLHKHHDQLGLPQNLKCDTCRFDASSKAGHGIWNTLAVFDIFPGVFSDIRLCNCSFSDIWQAVYITWELSLN